MVDVFFRLAAATAHRRLPRQNESPVGASLLAKIVNDNAGILDERVVLGFFASKLAPTGFMTINP
ncbi:hypothetical protein AU074_05535 [Pseudomonas sp. ATCC PTA-122608]|nr:hypothetical protein AU074_05535 [Pseudomonas sp. ATCC PTA-122608]